MAEDHRHRAVTAAQPSPAYNDPGGEKCATVNEASNLPMVSEQGAHHPRLRRAAPVFFALGLAGLLFAACGGASGPGVASIGSTTTSTIAVGSANPSPFQGLDQEYDYALSYAECMRTHGVPGFPDPVKSSHQMSFNPKADSNSPQFSSANDACKHLLPDNGGPPSASQIAAETTRLLKFAQCMRTHGVPNFSDPTIRSGSDSFEVRFSAGIPPSSPQFQVAQKACQSLSLAAVP
jgi:hypothetical protein